MKDCAECCNLRATLQSQRKARDARFTRGVSGIERSYLQGYKVHRLGHKNEVIAVNIG